MTFKKTRPGDILWEFPKKYRDIVLKDCWGGGPRVVVSTATFHGARFPVAAVWKKQKMFLPHPRVKVSILGSLRDREVTCSTSDRQGSNFESCVWRTASSQSYHHPQEVLLAQFSLAQRLPGVHLNLRITHCEEQQFITTRWNLYLTYR